MDNPVTEISVFTSIFTFIALFSVEDLGIRVYGVFDGFGGSKVSDFAVKKLPAELCLGQVSHNSTNEAIREALRQAFQSLDREYFNFIGIYHSFYIG
jgi:serine/threonine protein phosphatase PrpC